LDLEWSTTRNFNKVNYFNLPKIAVLRTAPSQFYKTLSPFLNALGKGKISMILPLQTGWWSLNPRSNIQTPNFPSF